MGCEECKTCGGGVYVELVGLSTGQRVTAELVCSVPMVGMVEVRNLRQLWLRNDTAAI
jgi:hypothetical protein